jgi:AraC-like DNA-binding protein
MYEVFNEILRALGLFGFLFFLLLAAGQLSLKKQNRMTRYYALFYFCQAVLQMGAWNVQLDLTYRIPEISFWDLPFIFAAGSLVWLLYKEILVKASHVRDWAHFILPALVFIGLIPYYFESSAGKAGRISLFFENSGREAFAGLWGEHFLEYLYAAGIFTIFVYIVFTFRNIAFIWKLTILKTEKAAQLLALVLSIAFLACFSSLFTLLLNDFMFMRIAAALVTMGACIKFLSGYRYPQFNQSIDTVINQAKYRKSYLKDMDLKLLNKKLSALMESEKLYRDDELSLSSLSARLDISIHQLSQFINETLNKNFYQFVNEYRIEEARDLLQNKREANILEIAYEVGFNSKSSFNRAFSKLVGKTPAVYRQGLNRGQG